MAESGTHFLSGFSKSGCFLFRNLLETEDLIIPSGQTWYLILIFNDEKSGFG
jgi:hypothetical protein